MASWIGRKALVTGATGFAGRRLVEALAGRGCAVAGFEGRVQNAADVERALRRAAPDAVFHLAAQSLAGPAREDPAATFETNVAGTWVLLDACRRLVPAARVVVASSDAAYGEQRVVPCDEGQPLAGLHPYDASKACADVIARSYAATYGLRVGVARPGNLYGPGDFNFSRIVPGTIRSALRGERPVIRSDGSPLRDYLHVDDMAEGFVALAEALEAPAFAGRAYNFATGEAVSVLALTRLVLRIAGRADLEPAVLGEPAGAAPHRQLAVEAAWRDLGWRPAAPLAERLAQTIAWYRAALEPAAQAAARGG